MSLWNNDRVKRYIKLYGDPREARGTQSQLCKDAAGLIVGERIIDFGCGLGHLVPFLPEKRKYLGLDSSQEMLETFREFWPGLTAYTQDITHDLTQPNSESIGTCIPFFSRDFSTAICVSVLLHLSYEESLKVLKNMWHVAGKAIVFSMETNGDREVFRVDGIRIRNRGTNGMIDDLKETLEITDKQIKWFHQAFYYNQGISVIPSSLVPLEQYTPQLVARTTLFQVIK